MQKTYINNQTLTHHKWYHAQPFPLSHLPYRHPQKELATTLTTNPALVDIPDEGLPRHSPSRSEDNIPIVGVHPFTLGLLSAVRAQLEAAA